MTIFLASVPRAEAQIPAWPDATTTAIDKALAYLATGPAADGGWQAFGRSNPAISALVIKALLQDRHYGLAHPAVKRGLDYIMHFVQSDGGIYVPGEGMRNYYTSVCLLALSATKDKRYQKTIQNAQRFLKKLQWDEEENHDPSSSWYGGQGYGKHKRPDLSNTQLMLEALHQSGISYDDPAYKKALAFVSRCQMLSETNDQSFARGSEDGGFIYTPVGKGESKAGTKMVDGQPRFRTYGSMTYAGFKSMLYAQVSHDDVRIKRALAWMQRHYTLNQNPNMPNAQSQEGLYYYFHTFARALDAWGEDVLVDAKGQSHMWRRELCEKFIDLQRPDGSFSNQADRWFEGNPHLVTAYAVLAMQTALKESK